jgi:hypothetical protein
MRHFKSLLWPILFVFRLTGVLPLTSQFAPSRRGQLCASIVLIISVTLGCVRPYRFIMKSDFKPEDFMQIFGVSLTTFSAFASFYLINFRIKEVGEVLTKLQLIHESLNTAVKLRLMFSVWLPFFVLYLIPMLYKIILTIYSFESFFGLLLDACPIARANYNNSSVLTFIVMCNVINAYYKEILRQFNLVQLSSRRKNSKLENLKLCHQMLHESAEGIKNLYGFHILVGLVTSNLYFQMSVFKSLQKLITSNDIWTTSRKILQTFVFMSVDIIRIILCFNFSNSIYAQVNEKKYILACYKVFFTFQSQRLRDVLCKSVNQEKNLKTRDLVSVLKKMRRGLIEVVVAASIFHRRGAQQNNFLGGRSVQC